MDEREAERESQREEEPLSAALSDPEEVKHAVECTGLRDNDAPLAEDVLCEGENHARLAFALALRVGGSSQMEASSEQEQLNQLFF